MFTDCTTPEYHNKWVWKGDNLCMDDTGGECFFPVAKQQG